MSRFRFTLIELLVVIAIIAILSAMMLPALSASRRRADSAACIANLKQLSIGFLSYCSDFGYTPPVYGHENRRWYDLIYVYINDDKNVLHCPADRIERENDLSYGINQTYPRKLDGSGKADLLWYGLAINRIKVPAQFIVLADACKYYIGKDKSSLGEVVELDGEETVSGGVYSYLALRHSGRFNAAFADGHTESVSYKNMPTEYWDYNFETYEDF